jgi:hypothetical protein
MIFGSGPILRGRLCLASSSRCCLGSSSAVVVCARARARVSQQHCPCCCRVACVPRLALHSQTGYGVRCLRRFLDVVGCLGSCKANGFRSARCQFRESLRSRSGSGSHNGNEFGRASLARCAPCVALRELYHALAICVVPMQRTVRVVHVSPLCVGSTGTTSHAAMCVPSRVLPAMRSMFTRRSCFVRRLAWQRS